MDNLKMGLVVLFALGFGVAESFCPAYGQSSDWQITFRAESAGLGDVGVLTLGSSESALAGYDPLDRPHPPSFPSSYLDLYTTHTRFELGWQTQPLQSMNYLAEFIPPLAPATRTINFVLRTDLSGPVTLTWTGADAPALDNYNVLLLDPLASVTTDMRTTSSYEPNVSPGSRALRLQLAYIQPPEDTPTPTATETPTPPPTETPTPTPPACVADYDLVDDDFIDHLDVLAFFHLLRQGGTGGDLNCDGVTDGLDLWSLSLHWQTTAQ